ncbi:MAG: ABC transporter ATP-binding protein [Deltaproteobacteria bacterium]
MSSPALLRLVKIGKNYFSGGMEVHVLQDITLMVSTGEFVTIMGASGSGKTTLLNILGCLDRPSTGSYYFQERQVQDLSDNELSDLRKRAIGFVFQSFNLLPRLTASANVELPLIYQGVRHSERRRVAEAMLQQVGLWGKSHRLPGELSGGEQQRVAIARALIARPQVLLADEPTGNLDSKTGKEIMKIFKELHETGLTIVMVTHSPDMSAYAERTILIRDGQI